MFISIFIDLKLQYYYTGDYCENCFSFDVKSKEKSCGHWESTLIIVSRVNWLCNSSFDLISMLEGE